MYDIYPASNINLDIHFLDGFSFRNPAQTSLTFLVKKWQKNPAEKSRPFDKHFQLTLRANRLEQRHLRGKSSHVELP